MERRFNQVDVFSERPYKGNPLGVVLDCAGLDTESMREYSIWSNLSEVTYLLPATDDRADYRFRIFALSLELPFAGHPTLGTARAWLDAGGVPQQENLIMAECDAGLIPIRIDGEQLSFVAPPPTRTGAVDPDYLAELIQILGVEPARVLDAAWMDNGPGWVGLLLDSATTVLELNPNAGGHPGEWNIGVIGALEPGQSPTGEDFEVRTFFAEEGMELREDPVTGSFNAAVAQWMIQAQRARTPFTARQGTAMGRQGHLTFTEQDGQLWVGGASHILIRGSIQL